MPRGTKRAGAGRRGRPSALARISTADLRRELERRQGMLQDLIKQRDELSAELQELQGIFGETKTAVNGTYGSARPAGKRGRPRGTGGRGANKTNLVTALHNVLNGRTLSVSEAADAVQKAGYKTKSPNFRTIVNQALISNDVFKKVARGQYTAK